MHIAVVGVGGTGGAFGGLLARAGRDVTFIARGATLAALRERGLTLRSAQLGEVALPVRATDDPGAVGPVDLILFCVKSYDTEAAAAAMRPLVGPDTVVLSVQNGIDNEERIAAIVGTRAVLGAVAGVSAQAEAPGVIAIKQGPNFLRFGELAGGTSPRAERALAAFEGVGFPVELHPDIRLLLWDKFAFICAFSGVTSLTRLPIGPILACPETRELYRGAMAEVVAARRAGGVALPEGLVDRWLAASAEFNPAIHGSMYYDLAAGRRMELDGLNGTVARLGREYGIPTPLNFAIYAALKPFADGPPAER